MNLWFSNRPQPLTFCILALLFAALGCRREEIKVYQVAKEKETATEHSHTHEGADSGAANGMPRLTWKTPAGWQEGEPNQVRLASFRVLKDGKTADVSVVPLGGAAGSDLANVNRWRDQVGAPKISEGDLAKAGEKVEIGSDSGLLFEQAGTNPQSGEKARILAAMVRRDDVAWFFKMTGDDALVAEQKPTFVEFLKSIKFNEPSANELPANHPPITGSGAGPALGSGSTIAANPDKPTWQVPSDWKEIPASQFLVAKFTISGADKGDAVVNVSISGGGVALNVNRWRQQLGLPDLSGSELDKQVQNLDASGSKAMLVDMNGTDSTTGRPVRVVGIILPRGGATWFYKLMGAPELVEQQKPAFLKFVKTATYRS